MTKLKHTRHVLAVHKLKRSTEFYRDLLGFTLDWGDENWSFMHRDNYSIMLGECKDAIDPKNLGDHSYYAYIETENIDGFYKDLVEKEVEVTSELSEKPWGMKEFGIRTVDGHRVMFGETVESTG